MRGRGVFGGALGAWRSSRANWAFVLGFCSTRSVVAIVMLGLAQSFAALPAIFLMRYAINDVIPSGRVDRLVAIGLGLAASKLAFSGVGLLGRRLAVCLSKRVVGAMRAELLSTLFALPLHHFQHGDLAQLHTRIVMDTERIDNVLGALVSSVLPAILASAVLAAVLSYLDPSLALLLGCVAPLALGLTYLAGRRVKRAVRRFQADFEIFSQGVSFVLRQMELTRTRGCEALEMRRQAGSIQALERSGVGMAMSFAAHGALQSGLAGLGGLILLIGGGMEVAHGAIGLGDLLTFYLAAGLLNNYAGSVTGAMPDVIAATQSLGTLAALRGRQRPADYGGARMPPLPGTLSLRGVTFGFGDRAVLRGVTAEFAQRTVTGIFGANGAGKSTLINLVLGFNRPWSGSLEAGGVPYDMLDLQALRQRIGVVPQRPTFFPGTIRSNLIYGRPSAEFDATHALDLAIDRAGARAFIDSLPDGLETAIGEGGTLVSGGEAQKLAIVRALVGAPKALILDEPTNHLDISAIASLMRRIVAIPDGPAILIISHSAEVARFCDHLFQLEDCALRPLPTNESINA